MEIKNIEGLTFNDLHRELERGAKFVMFSYCISILVMTFKRGSSIYFVKANESKVKFHWRHTFLSFIMGWWGIPWGPIYTIGALFNNFSGGKDVTTEVITALYNSQKAG